MKPVSLFGLALIHFFDSSEIFLKIKIKEYTFKGINSNLYHLSYTCKEFEGLGVHKT